MKIPVGLTTRDVTEADIREAQEALLYVIGTELDPRKAELIDGVLSIMAAAAKLHDKCQAKNTKGKEMRKNTVPCHTDDTEIPEHCLMPEFGPEVLELPEKTIELIKTMLDQNRMILLMNGDLLRVLQNPMIIHDTTEGK
jgi:hypothetical protein